MRRNYSCGDAVHAKQCFAEDLTQCWLELISANYNANKSPDNPVLHKRKIAKEIELVTNPVVFVVQGVKIRDDRSYLSRISPVFSKMFQGQFMESKQQEIKMQDIGSAKEFTQFLSAISTERVMGGEMGRCLNFPRAEPSNVVYLLKMADRFDVQFLIKACERHLMTCHEIPIIDRLVLADKFNLSFLVSYILSRMTEEEWKDGLENSAHKISSFRGDIFLKFLKVILRK
uniref:BTB domain-containing protein n=1 Tax=Ditylenchus dipsaci TaxID=166011 RepID=A0A915EFZ5_9BILA